MKEEMMTTATPTIHMRPHAGDADLALIADLVAACEAVDQIEDGVSVEELREEYSSPRFDIGRDLRLWEDAEGRLVGYAEAWTNHQADDPDMVLWFKVHPEARGALEPQIVAWGAARAEEASREHGARLRLRAVAREVETGRQAMLEQLGFTPDRYFLRMARPLGEPIPEPQLPPGFTLLAGDHDPALWAALYNESFIDHWNHQPQTVEDIRHHMELSNYRSDLNLVAVAPDGTFAAFCWGSIHAGENARSGRNEGWIGLLGSRRGFRRIGLGRAMLLAGLRALRAAGVDTAKLGVDADSLTGATRLYESVGFRTISTRILYGRPS